MIGRPPPDWRIVPTVLWLRAPFCGPLNRAYRNLELLQSEYAAKRSAIEARLEEFRRVGRGSEERLFEELCFCILAVQTAARRSDAAVRALREANLLRSGRPRELAVFLRHRTRFHNHKAMFIVRARSLLSPDGGDALVRTVRSFPSSKEARVWLVHEVDGLGLKEASHFLRNTGRGEDLAILDRHILRNLLRHGVLRRLPPTLTPKQYLGIEAKVERFSREIGIPMAAIDLLLWSRETGEIFK